MIKALTAAAILVAVSFAHAAEPTYEGRTASDWSANADAFKNRPADLVTSLRALRSIAKAGAAGDARDTILAAAKKYSTHKDDSCRDTAISIFGWAKDDNALATLKPLYAKFPASRGAILTALARSGDKNAVPFVVTSLADGKAARSTKESAIWALGEIGGDEAREALQAQLDQLAKKRDPTSRQIAATAERILKEKF